MKPTRSEVKISDVRFVASSTTDVSTGLLGWVRCVLDDRILLDGIALRRAADGRLTLSFPARRDAVGRQHPYIRPLDDHARRVIEEQVFRALGLQEAPR